MSRRAPILKAWRPDWIISVATHGEAPLPAPVDAAVLSPVYPSRSPSAGAALGIVSAARIVRTSHAPVIALGGVTAAHMNALARAGFAGVAGIDLFLV